MRARGFALAALLAFAGCSGDGQQDATLEPPSTAAGEAAVSEADVVDEAESAADEIPDGVAFQADDASEERLLVDPSGETLPEAGDPATEAETETEIDTDAIDVEAAESDESAADDDASTETDSATTAPSTENDDRIDELITFVEQARGYEFTQLPKIEMLDTDSFAAAWTRVISDDVAENGQDYVNYTDIYRAMGIIDDDLTLEQIWLRFGDAGVIGFYDPDTGAITLRSGEFTTFTQTVLVHELVHALEDQVFGLDRPQYDERDDEIAWVFSAIIEGSARRIESEFRSTFTDAQRAEETAARQALPRSVSLSEFTPSFLELQFGRYRHGENFANALWAQGATTFDDVFANPPAHSEAILDPSAFIAGSLDAESVRTPPADGDVFESGTWGQAGWAALFTDVVGRDEAEDAADGWDGDSFVAWRQGGQACVRTHLVADSAEQLDDYASMLEEWAALDADRDVFYPTADLIRVTACG